MAIRKTQAPSTARRTSGVQEQQVTKPSSKTLLGELTKALVAAVAPGVGRSQWLSEAEAKTLIGRAEAGGPDVTKGFQNLLKTALESGTLDGKPLQLGDAALQVVAAFAGVAPGAFRTIAQDKDAQATHNLAEGLAKAKAEVAQGDVVKTKNQLEEYKLQGQTGQAVSKSEFTPHFKAAKAIGGELRHAIDAHLAENHPEAKAAIDAVEPKVTEMINGTVAEIAKDPEAMKRMSNVIAKVGKEGLGEAMKSAAPDVGKAFTKATGVPMMNEGVVKGVLEGLPKLAQKLAPEAAEGIAKTCATVGTKLGVEVAKEAGAAVAKTAVKEGAEAVAKTAVKQGAEAVAKAAVKEGAEAVVKTAGTAIAKTAAKEGAEVAAKGAAKAAAAGGKAIPGLGNIISIGSACLAGVSFVKALFTKPRDGENIAKTGLNTLLQTVGIAFPWAALAGDVVDMGWSAKKAVTDAKAGKTPEPGLTKQDAAGLVSGPARLLASTLEGAGQGSIASTFKGLADATEQAANKSTLERYQTDAISQFSSWAGNEVSKAAAEEKDPLTKDALHSVAHGFGELFKVLYQHKKLKGEDGLKREEVKANLLKITGDVAMGVAALTVGGKKPELT